MKTLKLITKTNIKFLINLYVYKKKKKMKEPNLLSIRDVYKIYD